MSGHFDWAVIRACEREADRIRDRTISTCPTEDARYMLRHLREELRYVRLDRFGADLRTALNDALSEELLGLLDAAKVPDSYRIDAALPLRVVRLLHELLREIDEERPRW